MPKSGGAAILMQHGFPELQYVIGNEETVERMPFLRSLQPFSEEVLSFLNALSAILMHIRDYPDVATFGFWCRKAALLQEKAKYDDLQERLGKGIVFHSTPSNVPVNFAFSFASGLLAGNANIVRLPGKPFEQVNIICKAILELLAGKYSELSPYVCFVRFPPNKDVTDYFSSLCQIRVVWGGDLTVGELRQSPIQARTTEITFADRHSIAVINADAYLAAEEKERIIQNFYNDTYYTDQNACTSPRIVFWQGVEKTKAKEDFWNRVYALVKEKYHLTPVQAVGKLDALYHVAALKDVRKTESQDMLITRVRVDELDTDLMDFKYNSGFFFEKDIEDIAEIDAVCDIRCQTMIYYGVDPAEIRKFLMTTRPHGIDRAVPLGKSMDFSLIWDGCDLIRQMSRRIIVI